MGKQSFSAMFFFSILGAVLFGSAAHSFGAGWLQGDFNNNGIVNHDDAAGVGDILLGRTTPTTESLARADANLDGKVSAADLVWIQNQCIKPVVLVFKIDNGATSTPIRTVMLNNGSYFNPTFCMASESPTFAGAKWQLYSIAPRFTLSPGNGTKRIYFKVKNANFESQPVSTTITLNEIGMRQFVRSVDNCGNVANCAQQTMDGGYLMVGRTFSSPANMLIIKTDPGGKKIWENSSIQSIPFILSMQQTADGGAIIAGDAGFLIKIDSHGNQLWRKSFDVSAFFSVQQTGDGGYILAGVSDYWGDDPHWGILIKTDVSGNTLWEKTYGLGNDEISSVQQNTDGGYILAGDTETYGAGGSDAWLIKTDPLGNSTWEKTFGGLDDDYASSLQQTSDGGYILAGDTDFAITEKAEAWLIKTDASGNLVWKKSFGASDHDYTSNVQQTMDGGYILAGCTQSNSKVWLIRTYDSGTKLWEKYYGSSFSRINGYVSQAADGGFILSGFISSLDSNGYLIKTDDEGVIPPPRVIKFAINNGAPVTTSRTVTLNNICTGNPVSYMASESRDFSVDQFGYPNAIWQKYDAAPVFQLSPGNEKKNIYFKVSNLAEESAVTSATIEMKY